MADDYSVKHLNLITRRFEVVIQQIVGNDQTLLAEQYLNTLEINAGAHLANDKDYRL